MPSKIIQRIVGETGVFSMLSDGLSPSDLQSLLLSVFQSRVRGIGEGQILSRARNNTLFAPSAVDARVLARFDRHAFHCAEGFDAVDLAPVSPLGTTSVLGGIDQNSVLTTVRNAEVLGDSTEALAIESALRRRNVQDRPAAAPVRLCASHRVVRLQPFDTPGFTPHFRLFALASAGRDTGSDRFEIQQLTEHIAFYLDLFRALNRDGFSLQDPLIEISDVTVPQAILEARGLLDEARQVVRAHRPAASEALLQKHNIILPADLATDRLDRVKAQVFDPLKQRYSEAQFRFNLSRLEGLGYYTGLCLRISPVTPDGSRYAVADGGFVDWTARLLQDKKERLLTSGIGSELICGRFTPNRASQ